MASDDKVFSPVATPAALGAVTMIWPSVKLLFEAGGAASAKAGTDAKSSRPVYNIVVERIQIPQIQKRHPAPIELIGPMAALPVFPASPDASLNPGGHALPNDWTTQSDKDIALHRLAIYV